MPTTQVWVRSGDDWMCLSGHAGPRLSDARWCCGPRVLWRWLPESARRPSASWVFPFSVCPCLALS